LSLPADQRGLVAGTLVSEMLPASASDRYLARFDFARPTAGIDLMAGPYVVREKLVAREAAAPLRVRTYFYGDLAALADGYLEDSARYIELYSREIGAYPYDAFSVVASPLPTGFGMPTLTYLGAQVLKLPFIRATSLGHEVLHNWWGNGVYVDYAKGNWSEGLTTFMADYFYKERESADAAREARLAWLRDFAAAAESAQMPLTAFRSRMHGGEAAVGYGKSAMLFVMLRDTMGTEAFRKGLRAFWDSHKFKVATWDDLRAAFEGSGGQSLKTFFEQWVDRGGGPAISVTDARAKSAGGKTMLSVTVVQSKPAYSLELPIELSAEGRSETRRVAVDRERQDVTLELGYIPESLRIDPDLRIWRLLAQSELPPILRQWIVARSPRLIVVSADTSVNVAAEALARAFFESAPRAIEAGAITKVKEPVFIVGLHADVDAILKSFGEIRPAAIANKGSAQVWTIAATDRHPSLAVISARDADALKALARPLPHYGSQSYLAFDGAQMIARGVWPAQAPVITVRR
jgi:aminopeptidase N